MRRRLSFAMALLLSGCIVPRRHNNVFQQHMAKQVFANLIETPANNLRLDGMRRLVSRNR
jgi:uncharacterized protein YjeT (DUF2065 family)